MESCVGLSFQFGYGGRNARCKVFNLAVCILLSWPHETAQPVLLVARNDVYVKVVNALTDSVVCQHQCAVAVKRGFERACNELRGAKNRFDQVARQFKQIPVMLSGYHQNVSCKYGPRIQKTHHVIVIYDDPSGNMSGDDVAEQAVLVRLLGWRVLQRF